MPEGSTRGGIASSWRSSRLLNVRNRKAGSSPQTGGLAEGLARSSAAAFVVYGLGAGMTCCVQFALARIIGADGYGIYAYVLAWMTALAYASALGFNVSLMRFVPAYQAVNDWPLLRGVIQYAGRRTMAVGCGVSLVGLLAILLQINNLPVDRAATFIVGLALVPILSALWIRCAIVRALRGVVFALAPDRVVRDGVLLGFIGVASLGAQHTMNAPLAMAATVVAAATGLGLVMLAMRHFMPSAAGSAEPVYDAGTWRQTALPLVAIGVADILMNRTGVILLGWMADSKDAGIYALAFNIAFVAVLPQTAVNALLTPAISDLFVRNNRAELRAVIAKAAWWTLLSAGAIAVPIGVFAGPILALFGHDFSAGVPALRILLFGQLMVAGAGSQLYLLSMTGHERSAALVLVVGVACNAGIGAALIGRLGPSGAAIGATAALIGLNAAMALCVWRHLRFLPGVFSAPRW